MELERTFDENVYSNVDDGSVFPLFVRYSEKNVDFNNKNNSTSFEDMVAQIKAYMSVALFIDGKKIETVSY